jgi:NAD(P)-dependent dehydrogenase (short-subunit alcohol dehydrogenase family)
MSDRLISKSFILLTGASSGIGREIAIAISEYHHLILGGRDITRLQETQEACYSPSNHVIWPFDLQEVDSIEKSLSEFIKVNDSPVSGFVHCAAIFNMLPLRSSNVKQTINVMNTNVISAMEIVRLLTRKNINAKNLQSVAFISSIASQFGARGLTTYCSSKAALDGLMRALAVELAPDVRVNSVLPGGVRTPMTEEMFDDPATAERLTRDYPLGIGLTSDITNAVSFLLSDKARWITGQQLVVDGGRSVNISA